ncbi:hypothetical protein [Burkholderia ubonensis]|uniref:hypothetical protein n=1 Tax=Burkholderia ubonensis TaxID=101571 RepID=UPI001E594BB1|nr:hypothetical protein [Burkholderia ubonensis]
MTLTASSDSVARARLAALLHSPLGVHVANAHAARNTIHLIFDIAPQGPGFHAARVDRDGGRRRDRADRATAAGRGREWLTRRMPARRAVQCQCVVTRIGASMHLTEKLSSAHAVIRRAAIAPLPSGKPLERQVRAAGHAPPA